MHVSLKQVKLNLQHLKKRKSC